MGGIACMFPGVGSQYPGMGQTLYDNFKIVKDTFEEASDALSIDIANMCFSTKKGKLQQLKNAQLTLVTTSVATFRVYMQEIGIKPKLCLGHSLGEYSALCCAGALPFSTALQLVKQRETLINEACTTINGTMMWVINLDKEIVAQVCRSWSNKEQQVFISAYDSCSQTSISGHVELVMKVAKELEKKGAIIYPLKMSGPFHSPLMKSAAQKMACVLQQYQYEALDISVIANQNALPYENTSHCIQENLSCQLVQPILWKASIDYLIKQKIDAVIEIGPKDVLKFLVQKNTKAIRAYNIDKYEHLLKCKQKLVLTKEEFLSVIGKCLKTVVTTKNRNNDQEEYQRSVVEPYQEINTIYQTLKETGEYPTIEQVNQYVQITHNILKVKQVPKEERQKRLYQLWGGKFPQMGRLKCLTI